jgi:hypothetical protein
MVAWVTLLSICAFAVSFYIRLVVALFREYRRLRRGLVVRINPAINARSVIEISREDQPSARAAWSS